ncbi:MAG: radical SAM protein [Candidatus Omnitrophota bacterium]|nr:radical SAM protein [Candidatus Omnitrophota bacterium]
MYPDSILKNGFVDFVIIGDGESAFSGLLDYAISKRKRLEDLNNIGYKDNGQLKYTKRSFFDLEKLPQPAWHLIKVEKYIRRKFYASRVITINTSRGCPYKCSFCCVPKVHLGNWRGIRAEKIIENLKYLKEHYHIDGFQVDDDEFDINRERVLKLCDLLQKNNLKFKWSHFSRINLVKEDVIKTEIKCGLRLVEFGIESGSDRVLNFLNKGQTVEQIINVFNLCRRLKLKVSALLMIGLPTETENDLMATVKLVKRLNPYITLCTIYRPYPGTELFNYCINKDFLPMMTIWRA